MRSPFLSSFVLDPVELASARAQFGYIFNAPLVLACSADIAPLVAKELQPER